MAKKLKWVGQPIDIGSVHLKNRLVHMGSQGNIPKNDQGDAPVSPRWVQYYDALAAGGFSLVSIGGGMIKLDEDGAKGTSALLTAWKPEGLKIMADTIHKHGAAAFWQLLVGYPSRQVDQAGKLSLASSNLTQEDLNKLVPLYNPTQEMTHEQIATLVATFADVAALLQESGFDGVEINAGHVHGLNTFLSSAWNKRTDEYGGTPENRCRIMCEINKAIKERCGQDFAIVNNISGCEFLLEGGQTVADAVAIAKCLEASGANAIHSRYEMYHEAVPELDLVRTAHEAPDIDLYPGYLDQDLSEFGIDNSFGKGIAGWAGAAAAIKAAVNIPVSVAGRMDAFSGDKLIADGKIDLVNICRRAIADHEYCNKALEGRYEDIRPCIGCFTCYDTSERGVNSWCMVNGGLLEGPEYARIEPAETKKRVLVIGSGATGLESARIAALRGHEVILCEKEKQLGGTLPLAGMMKDFHEDFLEFSKWQQRQVKQLGVDIRTKTTVDADYVRKVAPDVIIVAVGGAEPKVDIPGIDKKIVVTGEQLHDMLKTATKFFDVEKLTKLSKLYLPLGKRIILLGGGMQGLQTAHFLIKRGREVVILDDTDELGYGMLDCGPKPNMLRWLHEQKVDMRKGVKFIEITDEGIVIENADGTQELIKGDNVVTTLPLAPNMGLYEQVKDLAPEVYAIGDCNPYIVDKPYPPLKLEPVVTKTAWPRFTAAAIHEAYRIVRDI